MPPTAKKANHKSNKVLKWVLVLVLLALSIAFVAKSAGPELLKLYLKSGIGDCANIPILCMAPEENITQININKEYLNELLPYKFPPDMQVFLPKEFTVVKERITKVYYKRKKRASSDATFYLLYEPPDFFSNLFPQLKNRGIEDDYGIINRTMGARLSEVKTLNDAFFMIMKGIFTPDLGDQTKVKMATFVMNDLKGFINYNLSLKENFFDCNIFDKEKNFFKIYIKDRQAALDLEKVFTIISTVKKAE